MSKVIRFLILFIGVNIWFIDGYANSNEILLTMPEAIQLVTAREPMLKQTEANANALEQQSIANGQLHF